ncbi:MAG: DNA cytosine methyltransferase [Thermoplasmata archaeon]
MERGSVLDLFSGMGGLSSGFAGEGFEVTGVDMSDIIGDTYMKVTNSSFIRADLSRQNIRGKFDVVVGGPPCKPWSSVNQSRRGTEHRDFGLIGRFYDHVLSMEPRIFIMENVPLLRTDPEFHRQLDRVRSAGYSVAWDLFRYSDYGAATSRRRLVVAGLRDGSADNFMMDIKSRRRHSTIVRDVIYDLRDKEMNSTPDHVWPHLRTVLRYRDKYESGKYGWAILRWDEPAPSFGNVMKTYILHPDSDLELGRYRPVSVLEVSRIMGFNHGFSFPAGVGIGHRYQMLVDSVSPVFSDILARVVYHWI